MQKKISAMTLSLLKFCDYTAWLYVPVSNTYNKEKLLLLGRIYSTQLLQATCGSPVTSVTVGVRSCL